MLAASSSRVSLTLALALACSSCSSSDPPPPPAPTGPIFTDAFDDAAPLPHGWDTARGDLAIVDTPGAPSGGRTLRAQAIALKRGKEALLHRSLQAPAAAKALTCRLAVNLAKTDATSPQTLARLDVGGGAVLFDIQTGAWNVFGTFGTQKFAEGAKADLHDRWVTVILTIESTGKIVMTLDGDQHVKHIDVKAAPLDVRTGSIEVGVFAPSPNSDTTAWFDDVACASE